MGAGGRWMQRASCGGNDIDLAAERIGVGISGALSPSRHDACLPGEAVDQQPLLTEAYP
jgi:hypothetical protein